MRPTQVRWHIAGLLLAIITLTYVDRINISVAATHIQSEFALSDVQLGMILSAFILGYALFQIPAGVLVDKVGAKRLLSLAVLFWSFFTALTAFAAELPLAHWLNLSWSFIILRFLVGVGEAPALLGANKIVGLWMAPRERALGNGIFIAGLGLGGAVTFPLIVWLMEAWGWRASFWVTALLGLPLLACWQYYAADRPEDHPRVNPAELALVRDPSSLVETASQRVPVPWRALLSQPSIWALVGSYFLAGYSMYIFFTWFFLYIVNVRNLPVTHAGFWATVPFIAMTILAPVGGYVSDRSVRHWGLKWGRRLPVILSMGMAAALLLIGTHAQSARLAILSMALAAGLISFAIANWWATTVDITRRFAGSLAGVMNTAGNLGGVLSPTLTPYLADRYGWVVALDFAAGATLLAGFLWLFVRPDRPLES